VLPAVLAAAVLASGCPETQGTPGAAARPDVFLILIDTLRKDHVHAYGYQRETTPTIDALAAEGLLFEDAVAQASWTLPSLISLFTSRYPPLEIPEQSQSVSLDDAAATLAEILAAQGYETLSITTNPYNNDVFNLMQGFESRRYQLNAAADWVVDRAIEFLEAREQREDGRPLFAYLHFMDVHAPRWPPAPYASWFPTSDGKPPARRHAMLWWTPRQLDPSSPVFRSYQEHSIALYDGALRFLDAELSRLLPHTRRARGAEGTVWVVTSDHGEELWDHTALGRELGLHTALGKDLYGVGHGHTLFAELVEVPLVISGGAVPAGRVATQVRLVDLAPTVLELAGVDAAPLAPAGQPLLGSWRRGRLAELPALSEIQTSHADQVSLRRDGWQHYRIGDHDLLLDLRSDRLVDPDPQQAADAAAELDRLGESARRAPIERLTLSAEELQQLRALGYQRD
jgi:arylsulfatase A-like enzyme